MKYLVIACNIMKDELLRFQTNGISFVFLEQSLHRTPQKMKPIIQDEIDKAAKEDWDYVILSYGLCSNGILGVKANHHRSLYLGSMTASLSFWVPGRNTWRSIKGTWDVLSYQGLD